MEIYTTGDNYRKALTDEVTDLIHIRLRFGRVKSQKEANQSPTRIVFFSATE